MCIVLCSQSQIGPSSACSSYSTASAWLYTGIDFFLCIDSSGVYNEVSNFKVSFPRRYTLYTIASCAAESREDRAKPNEAIEHFPADPTIVCIVCCFLYIYTSLKQWLMHLRFFFLSKNGREASPHALYLYVECCPRAFFFIIIVACRAETCSSSSALARTSLFRSLGLFRSLLFFVAFVFTFVCYSGRFCYFSFHVFFSKERPGPCTFLQWKVRISS